MLYNPNGLVVVVPDVHGRTFWKSLNDVIDDEPNFPIIFLGDYTDPYPQEGITEEECYTNFLDILDFKEKYKDNVTLLIGNHELHYFDQEMQCTRFSRYYYEKYKGILEYGLDKNTFQLCKQIDNYLFIHAGILDAWYQSHKDKFSKLGKTLEEQLNNYFHLDKNAFFEISYLRWGYHQYGSPIWSDIREFQYEEKPFDDNIIQIIGHTQLKTKEPTFIKNIRAIDNRKLHTFKLETGKFI
jgi:hypothetical protein